MKIAAGTVIGGQYHVDRRVGAGAMGEVWAGHRLSDGLPVALKVLLAVATRDGEALARFRREAQILARVRSEYVSQVLDFLTDDELGMTLVMELVPGDSLHVVLWREKKLSLEVMLPWAADILHGLRDLHACGVIHRDLKPGNIIARPMAGDRPRATLIDFGVGRVITGAGEEELTRITRGDRVLGTLEYMAPEQILGSGTVTGTADLYALGALIFRAVAGHHVFGDAQEGKLALAKLNQDPPPLPIARDDEIAAETQSFVSRLLARRSRERFESTEQALATCETILSRLYGDAPARGADIEDAETMLFDASALVRQAEQKARAAALQQAAARAGTSGAASPFGAVEPAPPASAGHVARSAPQPSPPSHTPPSGARRPPMPTQPTMVHAARAASPGRAPAASAHDWFDEPTVERGPSHLSGLAIPSSSRDAAAVTPVPTSSASRSKPEPRTPTPPSSGQPPSGAAPTASAAPAAATATAGVGPPSGEPERPSAAAPPPEHQVEATLPPPRRGRARRVLLVLAVLIGVGGGGWAGVSYRAGGPAYRFVTEWRARLLGPGPVDTTAGAETGATAASADATGASPASAQPDATAPADAGEPTAADAGEPAPADAGEPVAVAAATTTAPPRRRPPRPAATPSAAAGGTTAATGTPTSAPASGPTSAPTSAPTTTTPAPTPTFVGPTEL